MARPSIRPERREANLVDYDSERSFFSWEGADEELRLPGPGRNIMGPAVDRWAASPAGAGRPALIFELEGRTERYSYERLREESCRWAALLRGLGVERGDRVFLLLPPRAEVFLIMAAAARLGAVFSCLRPIFPSQMLTLALKEGRPKVLLTHRETSARFPWADLPRECRVVWLEGPPPGLAAREHAAPDLLPAEAPHLEPEPVEKDSPLYIAYTASPHGPARGLVHTHGDMTGMLVSARYALDLTRDSVLWTDSDPSGVMATVYGAFAPWLLGAASFSQGGPVSASTWLGSVERHRVTTWYTGPPVIRMLMAAGEEEAGKRDFSSLEHLATVGEPLALEEFFWARNNLNTAPHETWWMAETGIICLANYPAMHIKVRSLGRPLPGVEVMVLDPSGRPAKPLALGQLALKAPWPGLSAGIWNPDGPHRSVLSPGGLLLTGDLALTDEEGGFYLQGRRDDLVRGWGRMIGPFEVEALVETHPLVERAAAVATSDARGRPAFQVFATARREVGEGPDLEREVLDILDQGLAPDTRVKGVRFLPALPVNRRGDLLRRALRALDLDLPLGEVSGLAPDA